MPRSLFGQDISDEPGAWHFEQILQDQGLWPAAGVDEVGRGCLAGPVVAAAVILKEDISDHGITDSKKLSPAQREELAEFIRSVALAVAVAQVEPHQIEQINILRASLEAMKQAVQALPIRPRALLVDGNQQIPMEIPQKTLVKGDSRSCSIAAASIVAKVYRDNLMVRYAKKFPGYGFENHKGYGTREHLKKLAALGPCPIHRRSFKGVIQDKKSP